MSDPPKEKGEDYSLTNTSPSSFSLHDVQILRSYLVALLQ
jgi:hypothetical protein